MLEFVTNFLLPVFYIASVVYFALSWRRLKHRLTRETWRLDVAIKDNEFLESRLRAMSGIIAESRAERDSARNVLSFVRDRDARRLEVAADTIAEQVRTFYGVAAGIMSATHGLRDEAKQIRQASQDGQSPGDASGGEAAPGTTERAA